MTATGIAALIRNCRQASASRALPLLIIEKPSKCADSDDEFLDEQSDSNDKSSSKFILKKSQDNSLKNDEVLNDYSSSKKASQGNNMLSTAQNAEVKEEVNTSSILEEDSDNAKNYELNTQLIEEPSIANNEIVAKIYCEDS